MAILETLVPIFAVIGVGGLLRKFGFVRAELFRETNRLVFYVGLPCLLVSKTAQPSSDPAGALKISLLLLVGIAACMIAAGLAIWIMRVPVFSRGAMVQGAFRGNLAYVGLPVILFACATGIGDAKLEAMAVLAIAPVVPLYNLISVAALLAGRHDPDTSMAARWKKLLVGIATNPLVISCLVGLALSRLGIVIPTMIDRTLNAIGQMALPMALLGIGATLTFDSLRGQAARAIVIALIKVGVAPVSGWIVGRALGFPPEELRIGMLYLAAPTAVMSYIMAEQLGGDHELAAAIVLMSVIFAMPALAIVLAVTT